MQSNIDEIRALTAKLLDPSEAQDYVAGITEASVLDMKQAIEPDTATSIGVNQINRYIGHDMRYDGDYYLFRAGADLNQNPENVACGDTWWKLSMAIWNHQFLSQRCGNHNNLAQLLFTRR